MINHDSFEPEFDALTDGVRRALLIVTGLLESYGPSLGRPHVDTLSGSRHVNMKELRFQADDGVRRVAFAFDPERRAIVLVAGDKAGVAPKRFYKSLITRADGRFSEHLNDLKKPKEC